MNFIPPKEETIPQINLYMDQLVDYLFQSLESLRKDDEDRPVITKTMINNYVKAGIIEKPLKKRYTKSQIKDLIMISHFKNVLTMEEIAHLFAEKAQFEEQGGMYSVYYESCKRIKNLFEAGKVIENNPKNVIEAIILSDLFKQEAKRFIRLQAKEVQ